MRVFWAFVALLLIAGIALRDQGEATSASVSGEVISASLAATGSNSGAALAICSQVTGGPTMTVEGTYWGERMGATLRQVAALGDDELSAETFNAYRERLYDNVLRLWLVSFFNAANGKPLDPEVAKVRERQKEIEAEAALTCAVEMNAYLDCLDGGGVLPETDAHDDEPSAKAASFQASRPKGGEAEVWRELRKAGFNEKRAAGIMGNIQVESGFDPQIIQGGGHSTRPTDAGSSGYGLVQWTPGRKLSDYIGGATPTVANQVATLKAQLDGKGPHSEAAAGRAFYATTSVEEAAEVFHLRYERSASTNSSERIRNAKAIHARHKGTVAGSASAASSAPAPVCAEPGEPRDAGGSSPGGVTPGDPTLPQLVDNPSGRTTMDGHPVSRVVAAQIILAERESGIDFRVMQGGFGGTGYAASGTSHNYSGVVDLSPGSVKAEEAARRAGFAAWARNVPGRSYVGSGEHIHGVSMLDPGNAKHPQVTGSWARNENGLDGGKDPAPHFPWYSSLRKDGQKV